MEPRVCYPVVVVPLVVVTNDRDGFTMSQHSVCLKDEQACLVRRISQPYSFYIKAGVRCFCRTLSRPINQDIAEYIDDQEQNQESKIQLTHKRTELTVSLSLGIIDVAGNDLDQPFLKENL